MKYDHFGSLPTQLKLDIIKKCYPIPYVRLRRSCRFIDEFCEKNRHRLGIYCYQKEPQLYLLNTLDRWPFNQSRAEVEVLDKPHVIINYGKVNGSHNFLLPMTKENVPRIRQSLSGFSFTDVTISSWSGHPINRNLFGEAIAHFLEVTAEFHIRHLSIGHLTPSEAETIATTWKTVEIMSCYCPAECWDFLQLDCIKKIKSLHFTFRQPINQPIIYEKMIQELAQGKEVARFFAIDLNVSVSRLALENIIKSWECYGQFPKSFCYLFAEATTYYEANISEEWDPLMPSNAVYFGSYERKFKFKQYNLPIKMDIWISERPDSNIFQFFYITRQIYKERCCTDYHLLTCLSTDDLIILLFDLINQLYVRHPMDYAGCCKEMRKPGTLVKRKEILFKFLDAMATFYNKTKVNGIL